MGDQIGARSISRQRRLKLVHVPRIRERIFDVLERSVELMLFSLAVSRKLPVCVCR